MLIFYKSLSKLLLNSNFVYTYIKRVLVKVLKYIKVKLRITNYSNNYKVLLFNYFVILV